MKLTRTTTILAVLLALVATVSADWKPEDGNKMHWPQLPDLQNGLNVNATEPVVVADDFLCTQSGPITDIHIWGSWLNDNFPKIEVDDGTGTIVMIEDPGFVGFKLSIHKDIPKDDTNKYSRPGELLWERDFFPGEFQYRELAEPATEGFFDPTVPAGGSPIIGTDTRVIQYNFFMKDTADAFHQVEGEIYWLDVMALPQPEWDTQRERPLFGWKTTYPDLAFNDDSVWGYDEPGVDVQWSELWYPDGHPYQGHSMDQAFVITPEPATMSLLCIGGMALLRRRRR